MDDPLTPDLASESALTPAGRRVLAAANRLFYGQGLQAVGVEAVAEAAGVTKKTLYDRFGSKDGLVVAYLEDRRRRWHAWLADRLEAVEPAQRPLAVFTALEEWLALVPRRGCAFVNAAAELGESDPGVAVVRAEKQAMRRRFVELVGGTGVPADEAERLGAGLHMLYEGANLAYVLNEDDAALATARSVATSLLSAALGPGGDTPRPPVRA